MPSISYIYTTFITTFNKSVTNFTTASNNPNMVVTN